MDFVQLFITFCYLISIIGLSIGDGCVQIDECSCKTSKYTIDLHPLVPSGSKTPRFSVAGDGYIYDYEPCKSLASCGDIKSAAVCQSKGDAHYDTGNTDTATFAGDADTNNLQLSYNGDGGRMSVIKLQCGDEEGQFSFRDEKPDLQYNFILTTKYACAVQPTPPSDNTGGLSAGSVLLILFFVFLAVYFIGGILFLKFARGAQGTEMVPNYEFWKAIPGLIKDGIMFTCRGCKKDSTYSQI